MPLTSEQRRQIRELIESGFDDNREIASRVGVTPGSVAAVKAHITMGSYGQSDIDEETEDIEDTVQVKFGLERDLQIALRDNIEQLEPGLRITDEGKERSVEGYRFDITAEDGEDRIVIIELKSGLAYKEAVSQLLSYIGALMETGEHREIRGILVAHEFDRSAKLAARAISNIGLIAYSFQFTFEAA